MEDIIKEAKEFHIPIVRPKTLELLLKTIKEANPSTILEVGTATGYSACNMLSVCDALLTTIELNPDNQEKAKSNVERLGFSNRVEFILGDAKQVLKDLVEQNRKYDFVFLDGPKGQYINYLPDITKILNVGGILFADDVLFYGLVKGDEFVPHRKRTIVVNLRKYLKEVENRPFSSTLIDMEDGVCISKKVE